MKTKKIKVLFTGVLIWMLSFSFNSCKESNLDLAPMSETEASYFKNDYQFFRAIVGTYAKLCDFYWFNNNNPAHYVWMLPGDDLTSSGGYATESFAGIVVSEDRLNDVWNTCYRVISRANTILQKIEEAPNDPLVTITEETSEWIKGESLFLRSLMYYKLWNLFGTAPLITTRITDLGGSKSPNSTETQLLDQAIADLTLAATLLPDSWDDAYVGRATKESAYGLMGKCLVFRADYYRTSDVARSNTDYTAAIAAFDNITTRSLVPSFGDNFNSATENNSESLFEWQASFNDGGFEHIWLNNDFDQTMAMHAYWGFFDCQWSFWANTPFVPTQKLIDAFEPGDPRIDETFGTTDDERYNGYAWLKYIRNIGPQPMTSSLNNPRILRYADVLLLKAEAVLQTDGSTSDAIALINEIRTRARGAGAVPADLNTGETDKDVIMQWIMDERFRELSGEDDHRWFDLKRWHYAGFIDLGTWTADDNGFSSLRTDFDFNTFLTRTQERMWYPIPSSEVDQNELIIQNPGY